MNKVVVIGTGNVGKAYSLSLINQNTKIDELILVDIDNKKALGNAMDLSHTAMFTNSNIQVKAGSYMDCKGAKIVVIAAGANQKSNESRLELASRNNVIIKSITKKVVSAGFKGVFIVATNPVDIMTYMVKKYSDFDNSKVIGTGTLIDTARCKFLLSEKINVNPKDIDLYVLGEHGDSSFVSWSSATIGSLNVKDIVLGNDLKQIERIVKKSGYRIIDLKGETSFALALCLTKITNAIINNEYAVLPVSAPYNGIYLGMPSVINKDGIKGVMKIKLTNEEANKLEDSIEILKSNINKLEV
ncbi:MAG: L-lactate dehydrogenase [Bacilli bacterium]|nr:L-lactate dehydrogenase [Bacilli bacterium]